METIQQKLEILANNIIHIRGGYTYNVTWSENIDAFNKGLEIISYIKNQPNVSKEDWIALRKLTEELIERGIDGPVDYIRSYKRNKLSELTTIVKQELVSIPYFEEEEPEIETVNDWIKSLKIFKLKDEFLSMDYYQTSYDLYLDMKKVILTKEPPIYKKLYLGRVVDKIKDENSQRKLPENMNLPIADYELSQLTNLIKDNPDFNFRLMKWTYQKALIDERFEREEWKNNLLLLIKR